MEEKKMLLLGILRHQDVHGYILSEHLENTLGLPVKVKKANMYKLLGIMETQGWVTYKEEKEGNRPIRRVYSITQEGHQAFVYLVRKNLKSYKTPDFPNMAAMNYLDVLPKSEIRDYLEEREKALTTDLAEFKTLPKETFKIHPSLDFTHKYLKMELAWVSDFKKKLNK